MVDINTGYQSPIQILLGEIRRSAERQVEDLAFRAVQDVNISVDREELLKALAYDRGQYEHGYIKGRDDARDELVRCERCESWKPMDNGVGFCKNREGLFRMTSKVEHCSCGKENVDE